MKTFIVSLVLLYLMGAAPVWAQSMLEYGALLTATGAAGAAASKDKDEEKEGEGDKDKGPSSAGGLIGSTASRLYGQSMQTAAQRGGALLGQLGHGVAMPASPAAKEEAASRGAAVSSAPAQPTGEPEPFLETPEPGLVKIILKTGTVIEGRLVEQTNDFIRLESAGVVVTFFSDEISRVLAAGETP